LNDNSTYFCDGRDLGITNIIRTSVHSMVEAQRHLFFNPNLLQILIGTSSVVDKVTKYLGNLGCGWNKLLVMFFFNVIYL
jgi:hypothetical protein